MAMSGDKSCMVPISYLRNNLSFNPSVAISIMSNNNYEVDATIGSAMVAVSSSIVAFGSTASVVASRDASAKGLTLGSSNISSIVAPIYAYQKSCIP